MERDPSYILSSKKSFWKCSAKLSKFFVKSQHTFETVWKAKKKLIEMTKPTKFEITQLFFVKSQHHSFWQKIWNAVLEFFEIQIYQQFSVKSQYHLIWQKSYSLWNLLKDQFFLTSFRQITKSYDLTENLNCLDFFKIQIVQQVLAKSLHYVIWQKILIGRYSKWSKLFWNSMTLSSLANT